MNYKFSKLKISNLGMEDENSITKVFTYKKVIPSPLEY